MTLDDLEKLLTSINPGGANINLLCWCLGSLRGKGRPQELLISLFLASWDEVRGLGSPGKVSGS